jgi:hypothetical protein
VLEDGQRRAYSFTVPSGEAHRIDLHIRLMPGGLFTTRVFESMKLGDELQLEGSPGQLHPARAKSAAADFRGRRNRVRTGEKPARRGLQQRPGQADALLLGRAPSARPVHARIA